MSQPRLRLTLSWASALAIAILLVLSISVEYTSANKSKNAEKEGRAAKPTDKVKLGSTVKRTTAAQPQGQPEWATKGKFEAPVEFPNISGLTPRMIHATLMPNGKVLFWGRDKVGEDFGSPTVDDEVGHSKVRIWDPATNNIEVVDNGMTNLFCSGHTVLADGRVFIAGGHNHSHPNSRIGDKETNIFDPVTKGWTPGQPMKEGRWYPFTVTLETGEIAILAGTYLKPDQPFPNPTPPVAVAQASPEIYNPVTNSIQLMNAPDTGLSQTYPYVFLDPVAGNASTVRGVFIAGPKYSLFWNPRGGSDGKGAWTAPDTTLFLDEHRDGSAVMYDSNKGSILLVGGYDQGNHALTKAKTITLTDPTPQWQATGSMDHPRVWHTTTLLPDGKVLATGGLPCYVGHYYNPCYKNNPNNDPTTLDDADRTKEAEMWDPGTGDWSPMAKATKVRGYHSVALLLPDATVLVAGYGNPRGYDVTKDDALPNGLMSVKRHNGPHDQNENRENNYEIYKPPYLFDINGNEAPRPQIISAPSQVAYGQQFNVNFGGDATNINRVAWVRLPSVTHGFNQDQRINVLQKTVVSPGVLSVTAPATTDKRKCPPGYYMLFIFNQNNVPSKAKIIRISGDVPPLPTLSINDVVQAEGNTGTVNVNFTVSLSSPAPAGGVSFNIATADGTAYALFGDYIGRSLTGQSIPAGSSSYTFTVQVNGDTATEGNETFFANVTNVSGATAGDAQGQATITNDDSGRVNVALAANGAAATGSTTVNINYPASATINGDRKGLGWGQGTGGWADGSQGTYSSDVVQVNFAGSKYVSEIDVYTLRDNFSRTDEPTLDETFSTADDTGYGITHFEVQYWNGQVWVTVPGGLVNDNNKVWRRFQFPEVFTNAVRVQVHGAVKWLTIPNNYSRIIEVEAWGRDSSGQTTVWVDDAVPAGATAAGFGDSWNWVNSNPSPFFGSVAHQSILASGAHQHYFYNSPETISVLTGDTMFAYVYLDPVNPPTEVMLQWFENGSWEHRAYWGANQILWGADGTSSRRNMGPLPPTGQWVRLEVPASLVGLEGRTVNGMAFSLYNGRATWDYAGKVAAAPSTPVNLARQPGATATASSQMNAAFPVSAIIDGDRLGNNWSKGGFGSGWNDASQNLFSQDWLQVNFAGVKTINEIDVFTIQDNLSNPVEPTLSQTFSTTDNFGNGITDYEVQYLNVSTGKWMAVPSTQRSHVVGNDKVWRQFTFSPLSTNAIRVVVHGAVKWTTIPNNYSRIVEVEAYEVITLITSP